MIRAVVADDHALFRAGLVSLLEATVRVRVVGEAADGDTAVARCERLRPDILLLDVEMPGPATSTVLARTRRAASGTRIVIVSMHADHLLAKQWRSAGADAVVAKSAPVGELVTVLEQVIAFGDRRAEPAGPAGILTVRQVELLHFVARGFTNPEIARALSLSPSTVKRHLANIQAKLASSSRLDSVRRAQMLGLLD